MSAVFPLLFTFFTSDINKNRYHVFTFFTKIKTKYLGYKRCHPSSDWDLDQRYRVPAHTILSCKQRLAVSHDISPLESRNQHPRLQTSAKDEQSPQHVNHCAKMFWVQSLYDICLTLETYKTYIKDLDLCWYFQWVWGHLQKKLSIMTAFRILK